MSKELPYFRFTCQEWDTGDISLEIDSIKGFFMDICSYYWSQNCTVLLPKLYRKFPRKSQKILKLLESGIIKDEDGYLKIVYLDRQLTKLAEKSSKLSAAGKKGVEERERKKQARLKGGISNKDKDKDKDKDNTKSKKFIPPTFEDVKKYCLERNNGIDPQYWIDSYTSKGWMIGKSEMKSWKAAVRTWEKNSFNRNTTSLEPELEYLNESQRH